MKKYLYNPIAEYTLFVKGKSPRKAEIIGILQDSVIWTGNHAIELYKLHEFDDIVTKERVDLMARLDLGITWTQLAAQPVCITLEK